MQQPAPEERVNEYKRLLPQFRALVSSSVTDDTLLTYIAKSEGDLDGAAQRYCQGPWRTLLLADVTCQGQPPRDAPLPNAVSSLTRGRDGVAKRTTTGTAASAANTTVGCNGLAGTGEDRRIVDIHKRQFTSVDPQVNTVAWLGTAAIDVTSSCRIAAGTHPLGDNTLCIYFSIAPPGQRGAGRKSKYQQISSKSLALPAALPLSSHFFSTDLQTIKDQLGSQVCLGGRYLGTLPSAAAMTLGTLIYADMIRITACLAESFQSSIQIGSPIPILVSVYLAPKALDSRVVQTNQAHSVLRECLVHLLFSLLRLTPTRPSLLWSFGSFPFDRGIGSGGEDGADPDAASLKLNSSLKSLTDDGSVADQEACLDNETALDGLLEHSDDDESATETLVDNLEGDQTTLDDCEEANARTDAVLGEYVGECDSVQDVPLHPIIFRSTLRPYQLQGVRWMREHETACPEQEASTQSSQGSQAGGADTALHPMWDEFVVPQPDTLHSGKQSLVFYFSRSTGTLTSEFPANVRQCLGGILADEMGLGKTVQTIALLACELNPSSQEVAAFQMAWETDHNPAPDTFSPEFRTFLVSRRQQGSAIKRHIRLHSLIAASSASEKPAPVKEGDVLAPPKSNLLGGTLLVVPLSLLRQWKRELLTHLTPGVCNIAEFYGRSRLNDPLTLTQADVVLTTYGMVTYEFCRTQADETTTDAFSTPHTKKRGRGFTGQRKPSPLWLVQWRRIVLDEAHMIKSPTAKVSLAVSSLPARFRWCLTGTPIQNSVEDVYPLLRFLRVDPWGSWPWWSKAVVQRIQNQQTSEAIRAVRRMLHPLMLRRTKRTRTAQGKPILELPAKREHVVRLTLTLEEREFYNAVHRRITTKLDELVQSGNAARHTTHVLELLLRLRQAACHPLLIYSSASTRVLRSLDNVPELVSRFLRGAGGAARERFVRQQLEQLRHSGTDVPDCPICFEPPTDPAMGPCCHVMCRSCALAALSAAAQECPCPVCRLPFSKSTLLALPGAGRISKHVLDCLFDERGEFRYSSKLKSLSDFLQADVAAGRRAVVFSQWTSLLDIVQMLLRHLKLQHQRFDGSLSMNQREDVLTWFRGGGESATDIDAKATGTAEDREVAGRVLLVSLRAGGVGLNLTVATRCYIMDPWWNPSVESQAIQRIHRLGQSQPIEVYRLIVEHTVEERILKLQEAKDYHASGALQQSSDNAGLPSPHESKLKLQDLLELFKEFSS